MGLYLDGVRVDSKTFADGILIGSTKAIDFGDGDVLFTHATGKVTVSGGNLHVADDNGVVIGHSSKIISAVGISPKLQVIGGNANKASLVLHRGSPDAFQGRLILSKSRNPTLGSFTIVSFDDTLGEIDFAGDDGVDYQTVGASIQARVDATPGENDMPTRLLFLTTADGASSPTERLRLDRSGRVLVNESANANMAIGLTINQGANNNHIFELKSSDIAHALTSFNETDSWHDITKSSATLGGSRIRSFAEDGAISTPFQFQSYGGTADTTHTASGLGMYDFYASEHDGANALSDLAATGNIAAFRGRIGGANRTVFIIDEDGNYWFDGAAQAAFDEYDDLELVRAVDLASGNGVIQSEWDAHIKANEADLVALNILGAPVAEGGLVNGATLMKLHNGALSQVGNLIRSLQDRLALAESKLAALPQGA